MTETASSLPMGGRRCVRVTRSIQARRDGTALRIPSPGRLPTARRRTLDACRTTSTTRPPRRCGPRRVDAMVAWLDAGAGDPGRIHAEGLTARVAVEEAREQVAGLLGARPREVVFTSGATEAIAAACWGAAERGAHQVVPAVEHSAVRRAAGRHGEVTVVGVDRLGRVDPDEDLAAAVRPDTALVHVQWGNHEVGHHCSRWPRWWPPAASAACWSTSTPPRPPGTCRSTSGRSAPTCCR